MSTSKSKYLESSIRVIRWALRTGHVTPAHAENLLGRVQALLGNRPAVHRGESRQKPKSNAELHARIAEALKADPQAPYATIAARVGCDQARVAELARRQHVERTTGAKVPAPRVPAFTPDPELDALVSTFKSIAPKLAINSEKDHD